MSGAKSTPPPRPPAPKLPQNLIPKTEAAAGCSADTPNEASKNGGIGIDALPNDSPDDKAAVGPTARISRCQFSTTEAEAPPHGSQNVRPVAPPRKSKPVPIEPPPSQLHENPPEELRRPQKPVPLPRRRSPDDDTADSVVDTDVNAASNRESLVSNLSGSTATPSSPSSVVGELRTIPLEKTLIKSRPALTPPLPRPLITPPPAPPRTHFRLHDHNTSMPNGVFDNSRLPPIPPPQSSSFDFNSLPLRYADDDEAAETERRSRPRFRGSMLDSVSMDAFRLSELQPELPDLDATQSSAQSEEQQTGEFVCFSGWICLWISTKKKKRCWLILRGNELSVSEDDTQDVPFIGPLRIEHLIFMGLVSEKIHLIYRSLAADKTAPFVEYKFSPESDLDFWMQMLTKTLTQDLKVVRNNVQTCGAGMSVWLKQTIADEWHLGWLFITERLMRYWIPGLDALFELDLRRVIFIRRDMNKDDYCPMVERSEVGPIHITLDGSCLYIQSDADICTSLLHNYLMELYRSASTLEDHCVTLDGIPIIVDKCIRFISTYGMDQKGIYRKNGSAAEVKSLSTDFTNDPFNFHIMRVNDETSNVAASLLRSFLRQLSEPLVPTRFHKTLFRIAELKNTEGRIEAYRCTLAQFPTVYFNTIRRLVGHLSEVSEHSEKNLASIENLAKVFGPTVFGIEKGNQFESASLASIQDIPQQIAVVRDLLSNFKEIFPLSAREITAKEKIEEVQNKKYLPKARTDGFLVSVHLLEKDNMPFNVQSHFLASQIIEMKKHQLLQADSSAQFALFEVHCQNSLQRRVAQDEVLSRIVLGRWVEWGPVFPDSYLIIKKDWETIDKVNANAFADDVRYAESGSKSFKGANFKLESGVRIVCYSKAMKEMARWNLSDTIWFMGNTEDRKPPNPHTLTFFATQGSNKTKVKNKLAGACISFRDDQKRIQWLNCILVCKHEC